MTPPRANACATSSPWRQTRSSSGLTLASAAPSANGGSGAAPACMAQATASMPVQLHTTMAPRCRFSANPIVASGAQVVLLLVRIGGLDRTGISFEQVVDEVAYHRRIA